MGDVFDLFCGAGGFSTGARAAGYTVAFACDASAEAIETHRLNHPEAVHWRCTLPIETIPFPTDGRRFHVHASPPCQQFSLMRAQSEDARDARALRDAGALVRWSIETALASGATSWSLEQVASPRVAAIVEEFRVAHPARVAYGVVRFHLLGVPQTRKRLIAGSPHLVARLLRLQDASRVRGVLAVLPRPRGTHVRHEKAWAVTTRRRDGRWNYRPVALAAGARSVDGPAPTVTVTSGMFWVRKTADGVFKRFKDSQLTVREKAALQTFPPSYRLPPCISTCRRLVGNAVPPLVAELLLRGA